MDCLISFSTWVENNSGQIQIVIGLVALIFAVFGYLKILEQIKIANEQAIESEKNRVFQLKLNLTQAIDAKLNETHVLFTELTTAVDNYLLFGKVYWTSNKELRISYDQVFNEILKDKSIGYIELLRKKMIFLDDTFCIKKNKDLTVEDLEKILERVFENDLNFDEIKISISKIKNITNMMGTLGCKKRW